MWCQGEEGEEEGIVDLVMIACLFSSWIFLSKLKAIVNNLCFGGFSEV